MQKTNRVIVGSLDDGPDEKHAELRRNFLALRRQSAAKKSDSWHATATLSVSVGSRIGVAKEAAWIAAQACTKGFCSFERVISAIQWLLCPEGRCRFGCHVLLWASNQLASVNSASFWHKALLERLSLFDILIIQSAGNQQVSHLHSFKHAAENYIAVAAKGTNINLHLADLSAPGFKMRCASSRSGYKRYSGSSIAAAYAAGVAAKMIEENRQRVSISAIKQQLIVYFS